MAHIHEKIDFTTSVFIVRNGKVLLHKHKKLGIWLQPGGHIELDEDPNQAALREVKEETGFDVELIGNKKLLAVPSDDSQDLITPMFINRHHVSDTHEHVDLVYFGTAVRGELKFEEGDDVRWFGRDEIQKNTLGLKESVRFYALAAIDCLVVRT